MSDADRWEVQVEVDEDGMSAARADEFATALVARVTAARLKLAESAATADLAGVARALDELEDAHGAARRSGVTIPRAGAHQAERDGKNR